MAMNQINRLLKAIISMWPDVEFMSSDELGNLMNPNKTKKIVRGIIDPTIIADLKPNKK